MGLQLVEVVFGIAAVALDLSKRQDLASSEVTRAANSQTFLHGPTVAKFSRCWPLASRHHIIGYRPNCGGGRGSSTAGSSGTWVEMGIHPAGDFPVNARCSLQVRQAGHLHPSGGSKVIEQSALSGG